MAERGAFRGEGARAPGPLGVDLGPLRNGLGALENLRLLLESIKVGQKALFAAVSAVHADCAPMIASALAMREVLAASGVDAGCARQLGDGLAANLRQLEGELARIVGSGRLSVAGRLKLEVEIARAARDLGASLPLVSLLERASRAKPIESTPVDLIHGSSCESSEPDAIMVPVAGVEAGAALPIDLDAAALLVSIGVSLVVHGQPEQKASMLFQPADAGRSETIIRRGEGPGTPVRIARLRVIEPTLLCAKVAAERQGGNLDYAPDEHRVILRWPLSETRETS
jgi:hypothetical protein